MTDNKHFTVSGDEGYINRVMLNAVSINGVKSITRKSDTSAIIIYNPQETDLGGINRALRNYRSEKKEA